MQMSVSRQTQQGHVRLEPLFTVWLSGQRKVDPRSPGKEHCPPVRNEPPKKPTRRVLLLPGAITPNTHKMSQRLLGRPAAPLAPAAPCHAPSAARFHARFHAPFQSKDHDRRAPAPIVRHKRITMDGPASSHQAPQPASSRTRPTSESQVLQESLQENFSPNTVSRRIFGNRAGSSPRAGHPGHLPL